MAYHVINPGSKYESEFSMIKKSKLSPMLEAPRAFAAFVRSAIANPLRVGSICPSSPVLARAMAAHVPLNAQGLVVELGAGTGVVTQALLERGIARERLVVVECCPTLASHLRRRFPGVRICEGDAARLEDLLAGSMLEVSAVVSSLPLRSLSRDKVDAIMQQVEQVLAPNGLFLQYSYNHGANTDAFPHNFHSVASSIVWRNLPPARLDVFQYLLPGHGSAQMQG